jgi:hypothetical protein
MPLHLVLRQHLMGIRTVATSDPATSKLHDLSDREKLPQPTLQSLPLLRAA